MSQQSNAIAGSSQQHSDNSSLHYHRCWWAWCRCSFYAKRELLDHITLHHVQQVQPERLRDISARKIAESDSWDSLDFSSLPPLPSSSHSQSEVSSQEGTQCERKSLDYIPSSLPSPPASTPHDAPGTPIHIREITDLPTNPNTPLGLHQPPRPSELSNGLPTPPSKRDFSDARTSTPTFSSLHSQPNSPSGCVYNIPDSPLFNSLVQEAIRISKPSHSATHHDYVSSRSEDSSQDSVFNQLTQCVSDEESGVVQESGPKTSGKRMVVDTSLDHSLTIGHQATTHPISPSNEIETGSQGHPRPSPLRTPLQAQTLISPAHPSPTSCPYSPGCSNGIGTPVTRQSWYQPPRRRSPKKMLASESGQVQSLAKLESEVTSPASAGSHSGVTHLSPAVTFVASPMSQVILQTDQSQSQDWVRTQSQSTTSYPPLLTQAPYQSQSMSQD